VLIRLTLAALVATAALLSTTGCAVMRNQETVGAYTDDTGITTSAKVRTIDSQSVDAIAISAETLNGTVMLAGFAKDSTERSGAEGLTRQVAGVKSVNNEIAVRP